MIRTIVSAEWLHDHLSDNNLILLDASMSANTSDKRSEQIKGARFFDLKKVFCNLTAGLPNTIPNPKQFEADCQQLGIYKTSTIIIYDAKGIYTSPRAWWLFKTMGHENVAVLDGGLPQWKATGYTTETAKNITYSYGDFKADFNPTMIKDYNFMQANINYENAIVLDARSSGRFNGTAEEPRKELRSGHIPKSINIPYTRVLKNGKYKSKVELVELFKIYKISHNKPLVFSCGSGITACIIMLAATLIMDNPKALYDGSWTEWALRMEYYS